MREQLLANVARSVEREPEVRISELFFRENSNLTASTGTDGQPLAFLQPFAGRWMGRPFAEESLEDTDDWTCDTGESIVAIAKPDGGGGGVEVSEEGSIAVPWQVSHNTDVELLRGFFLDIFMYEPDSWEDVEQMALVIEWADKWRLRLHGNQTSATVADLAEKVPNETTDPWQLQGLGSLIRGPLFGQPIRLWVQPLDGDELLVQNRDHDDYGMVARADVPFPFDPDEGTDEDRGDDGVAPWGPGQLVIEGVPRAWVIFRYVSFPAEWSVETKGVRQLDYPSTQAVTTNINAFLPDGRRVGESDYATDLDVFAGALDGAGWAANPSGQQSYSWRLTATGPADVTIGGLECSYRALVLDRCELAWPAVHASDGASSTDLLAAGYVLGLSEDLGPLDFDARLTVRLRIPAAAPIATYCQSNARWQFIVDLTPDEETGTSYVRFDGLVEEARVTSWTDSDGTYHRDVNQVTLRKLWRDADLSLYANATPLDGLLRSAVYDILARQIPIPASMVEIGTLAVDATLPAAKRGERPAFQPEIGARVGDLFRELQRGLGPDDRLRVIDRSGTTKLYVDQPSPLSQAMFYRNRTDAATAGVPHQFIAGADKTQLFSAVQSDQDFYNDIIVVGLAPAQFKRAETVRGAAEGETLEQERFIVSRWQYPPSWLDSSDSLYVGNRRRLIAVEPQLKSEADVNSWCHSLAREYGRFRVAAQMASHPIWDFYPGDVLTVAAGYDPSADDTAFQCRGMRTEVRAIRDDDERTHLRFGTVYDLGERPA